MTKFEKQLEVYMTTQDDRAAFELKFYREIREQEVVWKGKFYHPLNEEKADFNGALIINAMFKAYQAALADERQLKPVRADVSNTVEVVYQYRHVNENGGWIDCDINGYIKAKNWFECEVRELFTAPAQSQSVKEALEAAAKICDDLGEAHSRLRNDDALHGYIAGGADMCAEAIRALIQDEKGC